VEHFDLQIPGLATDLEHLTIVQLTDIHAGPFMTADDLGSYVEAVNRLKPDLIALTGDFVSFRRGEAAGCVEGLAGLKAHYGVFACLGNHDFYARAQDDLTAGFAAHGVRLLRNEAVTIPIGNSRLAVLGIDDLRWGRPNLARAMRAANQGSAEVRILLSHRPEIFPRAARRGIDVTLAGHYHGGQIKLFPGRESPSIANLLTEYAEGLFHLSPGERPGAKDSILFVSRGIGVTALPIRFNCPPQIAHLTIRKA
jgi:predicted MPP superfamily phosphohydrolase